MRRGSGCWPVLVLIAVVACAPDASAPEATPWSEPGWMAEQAKEREVFVARLQACMDARGWQLTVDDSAGFTEPFSSMDEAERAGAERDGCLEEMGVDTGRFSHPLTEAALRVMYRYDVDTYECLVAQGVALEEVPPSADQYVEDGLAAQAGDPVDGAWWPYGDRAVLLLEADEVAALARVCPERWSFAGMS